MATGLQCVTRMHAFVLASILAASAPPLVEADVPLASPRSTQAHYGVSLELGAPSGAAVSLNWRPFSWATLQVGAAHNGAAPGIHGGISFSPWRTFLRPNLSLSGGAFAAGDAQQLVRFFTGNPDFTAPILSKLEYDYASAHLGVEIGPPDGASFFLRGGISRTWARLGGFEDQLRASTGDSTLAANAPAITLTTPSLQLGVLVFFR